MSPCEAASSGEHNPLSNKPGFLLTLSTNGHSGMIDTDNKAQRSAGVYIMQATINNSSYLNALLCVLVYNPVKEAGGVCSSVFTV